MGTKIGYALLIVFMLISHVLQNFFRNRNLNKIPLKIELFLLKIIKIFQRSGSAP